MPRVLEHGAYLSGNLCRRAAYPEIVQAVKLAAQKAGGEGDDLDEKDVHSALRCSLDGSRRPGGRNLWHACPACCLCGR
jgi:hypothetical protein